MPKPDFSNLHKLTKLKIHGSYRGECVCCDMRNLNKVIATIDAKIDRTTKVEAQKESRRMVRRKAAINDCRNRISKIKEGRVKNVQKIYFNEIMDAVKKGGIPWTVSHRRCHAIINSYKCTLRINRGKLWFIRKGSIEIRVVMDLVNQGGGITISKSKDYFYGCERRFDSIEKLLIAVMHHVKFGRIRDKLSDGAKSFLDACVQKRKEKETKFADFLIIIKNIRKSYYNGNRIEWYIDKNNPHRSPIHPWSQVIISYDPFVVDLSINDGHELYTPKNSWAAANCFAKMSGQIAAAMAKPIKE